MSAPAPFDCHTHVFTRDLPLAPDAAYRPDVEGPVDRLIGLLDRHGLAGAVLTQPSFFGTDNAHMLGALAAAPERLRAVVAVTPDAAGDLTHAGVAGLRFNLDGRAVPDLAAPPWRALLERVAWSGQHVEVQAQGEQWHVVLPPLLAIGVRVVAEHFGRPADPSCAGWQALLDAARRGDVWAKLSAPYRNPGVEARAAAAALLDALGPDRLVWGSDWPWLRHREIADYAATLAWIEDWIPDAATRRRILVDNPATLYRFGSAADPGSWASLV